MAAVGIVSFRFIGMDHVQCSVIPCWAARIARTRMIYMWMTLTREYCMLPTRSMQRSKYGVRILKRSVSVAGVRRPKLDRLAPGWPVNRSGASAEASGKRTRRNTGETRTDEQLTWVAPYRLGDIFRRFVKRRRFTKDRNRAIYLRLLDLSSPRRLSAKP